MGREKLDTVSLENLSHFDGKGSKGNIIKIIFFKETIFVRMGMNHKIVKI